MWRTGRSRWWSRKGGSGRGKPCRRACRAAFLPRRVGVWRPWQMWGQTFAPRQQVAKQESTGQPVHGGPGQSAPRLWRPGRPNRNVAIIRSQVNSRRTSVRSSSCCNDGRIRPDRRSHAALGLIRSGGNLPPTRRHAVCCAPHFPNEPWNSERPGGRRFLVDEQRSNEPVQTGAERATRREPGLIGRAADGCQRRPGNRHPGIDPKPRAALVAVRVVGRVFGGAPEAGFGQGDTALVQVGTGISEGV